ncbi:hypothetical protein [Lactiplantibacillus mudanjiangensis]|uniref:DUF2628 domain-containing protein n=1 Tax=Lactiplantibacillus mudanjiangensis TaxID=1296538 RepID=A0A660E297_9LACO|nr:hypothetical protein [Lactiplantibacillus mudanjiangensis]VDG20229.1 hypothetical protein [Lactobacillus pentosus] [Lactiplantibacillus mudanjiangensis]VDG24076.1 hypothetical protein [Lactobacillus pentosus] [Lactiplantibacillus mudanjiangensis]VDG30256.1 hypothetical protein [Lactobacillus pentosus] [Lactiplantibacillus mudanjiangensis]VDG33823.1 hypothetical protein [Lactobacillus pentosus] [Lactiplantibacillus mudanjiangensis]
MNFALAEWFGFNQRVKQDMIFEKEINGERVTKKVYGRFNWWALLFTWFYALFSPRCQVRFFIIKATVPFLAMILVNTIVGLFFVDDVVLIVGLIGDIWYGFMFETWFKNQLVADGFEPVAAA